MQFWIWVATARLASFSNLLVDTTHLNVKAHAIYDRLINTYPAKSPPGDKKDFPAKCWHCVMPESFYQKNCLHYHKVLQDLAIDKIGG